MDHSEPMENSNIDPLRVIVTLRELCGHMKLTPGRVSQLKDQNVVRAVGRDQYDLIESMSAYIGFLQERGRDGGSLSDEQKRLTAARADLAEIEKRRVEAELIPADEVEQAWVKMLAVIKTRLLAVPAKMAPRVMVMQRAAEIKDALDREIRDALQEVADTEV